MIFFSTFFDIAGQICSKKIYLWYNNNIVGDKIYRRMGSIMFFAKPGEYKACGLFTPEHFALIVATFLCVGIALKKTVHKSKEEVYKIIKNLTIILWALEIFKILYTLQDVKITNVKEWMPLYYCSLLLYAGFLSSFTRGHFRRAGDVFLATGSIVGGLVFILFPTTSLPTYPAFHFISIHSFFFHGTMVYLTLLINKTHYIELEKKDIIYFASLVGIICLLALIVNAEFNSNLMFISKNFPNTPIEFIYDATGRWFTPLMILGQMFLPFYVVYGIVKKFESIKSERRELAEKEA